MQDSTEGEKKELLHGRPSGDEAEGGGGARVSTISAAQDMRFTTQTLAHEVFTDSFVFVHI